MKHPEKNKFKNEVFENKPEELVQKPEGKFFVKRISNDELKYCLEVISKLKKEIGKVVIGQDRVLNGLMSGIICNGHVLLEGVPGIAKTLIIRALGQATGCSVNRIQFTVDLLPTDIIGIISYTPQKGFEVVKGPIFANFLIADEINRSPPKTQSALIEGMQERQVTIGKISYPLPGPFFVMATKNPVESIGVFSLPEAQMDRFLFNLIMDYPKRDEERRIMEENITLNKFEDFKLKPVISPKDILKLQEYVRGVYLGESVKSYILSIVSKTRDKSFEYADCIAYGASPRASIALFIASKAKALIEGRNFVLPEDVKEVAFNVMRHRIIPTYKSTIRGVSVDQIIQEILDRTKVE